MDRNLRPQKN